MKVFEEGLCSSMVIVGVVSDSFLLYLPFELAARALPDEFSDPVDAVVSDVSVRLFFSEEAFLAVADMPPAA